MDDDDAFLYGDEAPVAEAAPSVPKQASNEVQVYSEKPVASEDSSSEEQESEESDIEFIIDPNAPAIPPSRSATYAPGPAGASEHTARTTKDAEVQAVDSASQTEQDVPSVPDVPGPASEPIKIQEAPTQEPKVADQPVQTAPALSNEILPPEGPAPTAGITAPELDLSPKADTLRYPPSDPMYEKETDQASTLNIYQVDIDSLPEKPWRRPGAKFSDWFNYGFDEATWAMWCAQKNKVVESRVEFQNKLNEQSTAGETTAEQPYAPPNFEDPQNPMANFSAMFGPGMMGMPGMPGMQFPMMMPQGQATDSMPNPSSMMGITTEQPAENSPWHPGMHPLPAPPHLSMAMPTNDQYEPQAENHAMAASSSYSGHPAREAISESVLKDQSRPNATEPRNSTRSPSYAPDDDDEYAPEMHPTASRLDHYNDRDDEAGSRDVLNYGGSHASAAQVDRRSRRHPTSRHDDHSRDDDKRAHEDHGRSRRDRDRDRDHHGRRDRDRDRARSDRRSGRGGGGQKRGHPDIDDHPNDHTSSKRFNGGGQEWRS
ncbi:cleavage polyadenylation factor subunit fip1 [Malassezia yamatoensis]|uniref:Cleavage polyadenylation factor subunit fip1 n=1 Tax=Malassezia yamatoensis TaxID=253288 RepID=A0AAJ5YRH9_9BASI|nr:cleavage polyadenylation factor subunit fip1 [Malassezia yamatoensis]